MDTDGVRNWDPLARWLDQAENVGVAYRKLPVREVARGTIVRYGEDWGVLEKGHVLERWIGGPLKLRSTDIVEVLPPSKALPSTRERRPKGPPPDPR